MINRSQQYRIALVKWPIGKGLGDSIFHELAGLGHELRYFWFDGRLPQNIDVVFLHGPYAKFLPVLAQVAERRARGETIYVVFWNTEGLPDLRIPWRVKQAGGMLRSWVGRWSQSDNRLVRTLANNPPISKFDARLNRFRFLGDFFYAYQQGWIDVFADISAVYADFFNQHGLPTVVAPFGSFHEWYEELNLERDIDVLWMGTHGGSRRANLLQQVRQNLEAHGVNMYVADDIENPFIFDDERTEFLNRSKITLNLLRTWYDENSLRMCMAGPNRSLFVSEPLLAHVPQYVAGVHYVVAEPEKLAETIVYYLNNEVARQQITDNAYRLLTTELTMKHSLQKIMQALDDKVTK